MTTGAEKVATFPENTSSTYRPTTRFPSAPRTCPVRSSFFKVMRSMAKECSKVVIRGFWLTALSRAVSMAFPVISATCSMRRFECPPSFPKEYEPSSIRVNSRPNRINSCTRAGPSSTICLTTRSSHNPSPEMRVSPTCRSKSSVFEVTTAMPPCA